MRYSWVRLILLWIGAFLLTMLPVGPLVAYITPFWILLFILYLQFILPSTFHPFWIISSGLILDTLTASPLGVHVFALCMVCWCANNRARRFKFFSFSQQWFWVFALSFLYQFALTSIYYILGYSPTLLSFILPILMSASIWPWIKQMMTSILAKSTSLRL